MAGRRKELTREDRVLWSRVARTIVPLEGKAHSDEESDPAPLLPIPLPPASKEAIPSGKSPVEKPKKAPHPHRLDLPTREKLARGRLEITGRVDLHGLTQDEAYALLLSFLRRAAEEDRRYVLVITGKGAASGGILRRAVPQWLATPPFSILVGGYEEAARHHGGGGALYLRLRRRGSRG